MENCATLEIYLYMEENIVDIYGRNIFLCMKGFRKKIRGCTKSFNLLSPSPLSFASHNPRSEVNRSACRVACEHGYRVWVLRCCLLEDYCIFSLVIAVLLRFIDYTYGNGMLRNSRIVTRLGRCHNINATKFNFDLLVFMTEYAMALV